MSSDALLGRQLSHPSPRWRCDETLCRALSALRHWLEVTTSCEYLASLKRRMVLKLIVAVVAFVAGIGSESGVRIGYALWSCVVVPFCMIAIPYESLWLDIFIVVWNFADCHVVSLLGGPLWSLLIIHWMHAGGIHSFALLIFLLSQLGNMNFEDGYDSSGLDLPSFVALSVLIVVWAFVAEWQQADHFYRLQESTEVTQLLLEQATCSFCTLGRESGIVIGASSAFMESLGMNSDGATVFDFVGPDDRAKVANLLRNRGTLPPSPILCTLYRRQTLTGAPEAQFAAKLVPYAVSKSGVRVCLLKVSEERLLEAPRGAEARSQARAGEAYHAPGSGSALGSRPQRAQRDLSEDGMELGTETSFAVSSSTGRPAGRSITVVKSIAVQASLPEPSPRPPPMPELSELAAQRLARVPQGRRAQGRARVRLNTSMRQVPGFEETPWLGRTVRLMDAMEGINACGRGCCPLHVSVAAARRALDMINRKDCGPMHFGSRQCPECLVLIDPEVHKEGADATDGSTLQECETCGAEIYPAPRRESPPTRSTPSASDEMPLEVPARAPCPDPSIFKITVDRSDGGELGIDVGIGGAAGSAVLVGKVKEGLVEQWNGRNTEAEVRSGDYIVEVNGISGNPMQILAECGQNKILRMAILRSGPVE